MYNSKKLFYYSIQFGSLEEKYLPEAFSPSTGKWVTYAWYFPLTSILTFPRSGNIAASIPWELGFFSSFSRSQLRHSHQSSQLYTPWIQGAGEDWSRQICFRTPSLSLEVTRRKRDFKNNENINNTSQIFKLQDLCLPKSIFWFEARILLNAGFQAFSQFYGPRGQCPMKTNATANSSTQGQNKKSWFSPFKLQRGQ